MRKNIVNIALISVLAAGLTTACSSTDASELYSNRQLNADGQNNQDADGNETLADDSGDATDAGDMTLVFEDDFEGTSTIPDQSKWSLCPKGDAHWSIYQSESYDNAYQKDGYLYLIADKEDGQYKTAGIETRGKFDFQYGKVECRAKFARMPKGNHSGIWMMPAPPALQWPKSGELDIMEHLSDQDMAFETVHSWYIDDMGHKEDPESSYGVKINQDDWNTYGIIWTPEKITFTVNGVEYLSYSNQHLSGEDGQYQWPFDHPFYLILSQSLGGEGTWAGPIDDAELPAIFQIDWIKVYQTDSSNSGIEPVYPD